MAASNVKKLLDVSNDNETNIEETSFQLTSLKNALEIIQKRKQRVKYLIKKKK